MSFLGDVYPLQLEILQGISPTEDPKEQSWFLCVASDEQGTDACRGPARRAGHVAVVVDRRLFISGGACGTQYYGKLGEEGKLGISIYMDFYMGFPWDFWGGFFMEVLKLRHFLRAIWVWDIDTETFEIVWNVGKAGHLAPTGIFGDGVSLRGSCRFPLKQELQDTTKSAGHAILYIIISIYLYIYIYIPNKWHPSVLVSALRLAPRKGKWYILDTDAPPVIDVAAAPVCADAWPTGWWGRESLWSCTTPHFYLVGGLEHEFYFSIYWEESSQQSEG